MCCLISNHTLLLSPIGGAIVASRSIKKQKQRASYKIYIRYFSAGFWNEIKWNIRQVEKRDLIIMTSKAQRKKSEQKKTSNFFLFSDHHHLIVFSWIFFCATSKKRFFCARLLRLVPDYSHKPGSVGNSSTAWDFILIVFYFMLLLRH